MNTVVASSLASKVAQMCFELFIHLRSFNLILNCYSAKMPTIVDGTVT